MASAAALRFTLTAAHRVIDRVHDHAAHVRTPALPARAAGLAARDVHVIDVADLADRRVTRCRGSGEFRPKAISPARNRASRLLSVACWPALRAIWPPRPGSDLDVVNVCAERNRAERKRVAEIGRRVFARHHLGADRQTVRREDVALSPSLYLSRAMRAERFGSYSIADHLGRDAVLPALEIDLAVFLFVTAADVTRSQPAVVVAAAASLLRLRSGSYAASTAIS